MPLIAAVLVAVGLAFVARGILLTREGTALSRPGWLALPSKRSLGLAALAIVPLAFIAAAQTTTDKVPDAAAAPKRVERLTGGDGARPEPKARSPVRAPASAPAASPQDAAPASAAPAPAAAVPRADPRRADNPGEVKNVAHAESHAEPTSAPDREDRKGKGNDDASSSTPAPTSEPGDDGPDERDD